MSLGKATAGSSTSPAAMDISSPTKASGAATNTNSTNTNTNANDHPDMSEIGHYVVTSHPPGAVFSSFKCSFLAENSADCVIAKSNRLEIRQFQQPQSASASLGQKQPPDPSSSTAAPADTAVGDNGDTDLLPLVLSLPINGRILEIAPIRFPNAKRDCLFFITEKGSYALISYDETLANNNNINNNNAGSGSGSGGSGNGTTNTGNTAMTMTGEHYPILTHATGTFKSNGESVLAGGRNAELGPMMSVDPLMRCIALHVYDGFLTIIPLNRGYEWDSGNNTKSRRVPWRRNAANNSNKRGSGGGGGGGGANNPLAGGSGKPAAKRAVVASTPFSDPFHLRIEERTVIHMTFLQPQKIPTTTTTTLLAQHQKSHHYYMPQLALLHQDAYEKQHVTSHGIDLQKKALVPNGQLTSNSNASGGSNNPRKKKPPSTGAIMPPVGEQLKYSRCEGGSSCLIAVPPPMPPKNNYKGIGKDSLEGNGKPAASGSASKHLGGILILGQKQITYHCTSEGTTKITPTGGMLFLSHCRVLDEPNKNNNNGDEEQQVVRWLVGDERGRVHLLSLLRKNGLVTTLHLDALGTCSSSSTLTYLGKGFVFVGGQLADSQLIQILDEPVRTGTVCGGFAGDELTKGSVLEDTTYVKLLEEYTNLGPIVDFDLRACNDDDTSPKVEGGKYRQSLVATCSGVAKDGSVRLVRNGVGMKEHAAVDMEGIKGMWSLRKKFHEEDDTYLVQSFVRETRILGVQSAKDVEMEEDDDDDDDGNDEDSEEEEGGALAEVTIDGFNSSRPTLFAGNVLVGKFDLLLQVVEDGVRIVDAETLDSVASWSPFTASDEDSDDDDDEPMGFITIASANKSGQIVVSLRGGALVYLRIEGGGSSPVIRRVKRVTLDREISCIDLNPFSSMSALDAKKENNAMDVDKPKSLSPRESQLVAVGLWDDFSVRLLNLNDNDPSGVLEQVLHINLGRGSSNEGTLSRASSDGDSDEQLGEGGQHMMARSLCLVTMDSQSTNSKSSVLNNQSSPMATAGSYVDMLLVGLGDGKLISFVVNQPSPSLNKWFIHSRKEVSLGTQGIHLIPFQHGSSKSSSGSCVLATGDRPTVVYLTGGAAGSNSNPKLNYSTITLTVEEEEDEDEVVGEGGGGGHASHKNISVNVATPFNSSLLFSSSPSTSQSSSLNNLSAAISSLCIADEATLRLGTISDIQKLHVSTYKIGMTPRRICHHEAGRVYVVGCIGDMENGAEGNENNVVRFFDDSSFEELSRIKLLEFEMILTIQSVMLSVNLPPGDEKCSDNTLSPVEYRPFIVMGTAFAYPDEDEPSQGRVVVVECNTSASGNLKSDNEEDHMHHRQVRQVAEMQLMGGIYNITPFYRGQILATCGSKTLLCQLCASLAEPGELLMNHIGMGHHGHLISLYVKSLVSSDKSLQKTDPQGKESQLAIVGDLMRSISVVEYYPKHQVIEELARDFNSNYCTEIAMLTNNIYMGCEGFNNLFTLKYNPDAKHEQTRCRLDTVGQYHLGEMVNRMIGGSLIMPSNNTGDISGIAGSSASGKVLGSPDKSSSDDRKVDIAIGSQTLYTTVDGTIGTILGLPGKLFAFLSCLQRSMDAIIRPVGDLSRHHYRQWEQGTKKHPSCGFIDGDWIETFLDLNRANMERIVKDMIKDGRWRIRDDGVGFEARDDRGQRPNHLMDTEDGSTDPAASPNAFALTVEDVLAVVEELSMLH